MDGTHVSDLYTDGRSNMYTDGVQNRYTLYNQQSYVQKMVIEITQGPVPYYANNAAFFRFEDSIELWELSNGM